MSLKTLRANIMKITQMLHVIYSSMVASISLSLYNLGPSDINITMFKLIWKTHCNWSVTCNLLYTKLTL